MPTIDLSQFPGADDMERFRQAAAYLRGNPGTRLVLELKTYYLRDETARKLQEDVMAGVFTKNPEPLMFNYDFEYVSGIDLVGAEDVRIDGRGATLVFDGFMENITLASCKNVTLQNFNIDLARKAYSKGVVTGFGGNWTDADFGGQTMLCETMPTLRILVYSKQERRFVDRTTVESDGKIGYSDFACDEKKHSVGALGGGMYRFYGMRHEGIGDELYVTHTFHFRPSILIYEAENTTFENISIHSHCGMGVVGHRARDILMCGLKVVPSPGEAMSTNTDATHFASCAGLLRFEGCHFAGHGDDATNVHGYYHTIISADKNLCTAVVKAPTGTHSQKLDYFNPGDTVELTGIADLASVRTYKVLESRPDFTQMTCEYVLDGGLPEDSENYFLADVTQLPRLEFTGCFVSTHRSRCVLVKTRNVLIENSFFEQTPHPAVCVSAEGWWHEGVTAENVVIRGNRMINCGGISIDISAGKPDRPAHKNIAIENNIIDCPACRNAIRAANVDGLMIRANQIRCAGQEILIEKCVHTRVG